jgi:hypothetical protein
MTTPTPARRLVDRVEVIHPDGRHTVTDTPSYLAKAIYPDIRGYEHPAGWGFVIVERH